jgi:hypothetical protein
MNYKKLHTYILENKFGQIDGKIIKQDKNIRIIHLQDKKGISRTLGVVRFLNTDNKILEVAHGKILAGELLGKTLQEFNINFRKEFIGSLKVKLPEWLKKDFNNQQNNGLAFFSKISIIIDSELGENFLYSELIEIIPLDLEKLFVDKIKAASKIDEKFMSLLKEAGLTKINIESNYD